MSILGIAFLTFGFAGPTFAADRGPIEICSNGLDDDGDGAVDENDCQISPTSTPISGNGVVPEHWGDNPNCDDLGYGFGFKIGDCPSGTYSFVTGGGNELTGGAQPDPDSNVTIECSEGEARIVDWSSNISIDGVFVKGGPEGGNLYVYDPEATSDSGLGTPGTGAGISHVEFCYDYELTVEKTADGTFDRTYTWEITKDVDPAAHSGFVGDDFLSTYTVTVDQTIVDSNYEVDGTITITNGTPYNVDFDVDDSVDGVPAVVTCPSYSVLAGDFVVCDYVANTGLDGSETLNTATVTSLSPNVEGGTATAPVSYTATIVGYPEINVTDTNGESWMTSSDATWNYTRPFECSSNPGDYTDGVDTDTYDNTATIDQTGQSDDAFVTVTCYAPLVSKTVETASLTREYLWMIEKEFDDTYFNFIGDPAVTHDYTITVTRTGEFVDSDWSVSGFINVANPNPGAAMTLDSVSDSVNGVPANVLCPGNVVPAGGTLECTYDAIDGLTGDETLNTATAVLNGVAFNGTAPVEYEPIVEIADEINVTDTNGETFGPTDVGTSWSYTRDFECPTSLDVYVDGVYSATTVNTATIDETGDFDTATVTQNCYAPVVSKDADTEWKKEYTWTITKDVDPSSADVFIGDSATFDYTVSVDQTITEFGFKAFGTIYVSNAHPMASMTVSLADSVNGNVATLDCGGSLVVPAADSATCGYTVDLSDNTDGTNTATATFNGFEFVAEAPVIFGDPIIIGEPTINVDDTNSESWEASGDETWMYEETFPCSSNPADYTDGTYYFTHDNTATIIETDQSDSETIRVDCYAPVVSKDAATAYTREFTWTITKDVDPTSHTGFAGDSFSSDYEVAVDQTVDEYDFAVSGTITVSNPNPSAAMTVSIVDSVGGTAATLDCSGSLMVPAAGSNTCGYSASLETKTDGTNTATVTFNMIPFEASAGYVFGDPTDIDGYETINVTDTQPDSTAPWSTSGDDAWFYAGEFDCPTDESLYTEGIYVYSVPNVAEITETGQQADANVDVTCYIPADAKVRKATTEGPEDIGQFPFTFDLYDPDGVLVETQTLNAAGEADFTTLLLAAGTWTVEETLPDGWVSTTPLECTFDVAYPAAAGATFVCDFENTEMGRVTVLKLTNGVVNPEKDWTFALYDGPDGFGGTALATSSTLGDFDGVLEFDQLDLDPYAVYTVCELQVAAGWTSEWMVDTDGDGIADTIVIPYNPNEDDDPPEDLGNRCFDFGAGTGYPIEPGMTLAFEVDNTFPGGEPRTPGYWKNWNTCTDGNQAQTAAHNGGIDEGWYLLDDVLNDPGVSWGDFTILTCEEGVSILDQRDLDTGRKMASDAAYTLAMHLLAAQLNFGAGAEACTEALDAALAAENLLVSIGFDGTGKYLRPKDAEYQTALSLAWTLDEYNNGLLCGFDKTNP
jgi:hypothetical protein